MSPRPSERPIRAVDVVLTSEDFAGLEEAIAACRERFDELELVLESARARIAKRYEESEK